MKRNRSLQTGRLKPEPPSAIPRLICGRSPGMLSTSFTSAQWLSLWGDSGMDPVMGIKISGKKRPSLEMRPSTRCWQCRSNPQPLEGRSPLPKSHRPKIHRAALYARKSSRCGCQLSITMGILLALFGWHKVNLNVVHFIKAIDVFRVKEADFQAHTPPCLWV